MWQIFKKDFLDAFKTKKNIFVYLIFLGLAYFLAKNKQIFVVTPSGNNQFPLFTMLVVILLVFGLLIAGALFGGIVSGEVEKQTIRYIIPYVSRIKIYVAKFLAITVYLLLLVLVSFGFVMVYRHTMQLPWLDLGMMLATFFYIIALIMLITVVFNQERLSVFTASAIGIVLPVLALVYSIDENKIINIILKLTPYGYMDTTTIGGIASTVALGVALIIIGLLIFDRKEV